MNETEPGNNENQASNATSEELETTQPTNTDRDKETNQWAMFIHFSILAGWVVPIAGLIVPILLWQIKKDELPGIVPHAHVVLNWIVTSFVYALVCMILTLVVVGVFGFIALAIATLIFSIVGGLKANDGELWEYPGTFIKIFK
jgi:uncharacterized Tic20 family protein